MSLKNPKTLKNPPQEIPKMLRKSPASNVWAGIFKNVDFSLSSFKVTNWVNFTIFLYLKFLSVFIINYHHVASSFMKLDTRVIIYVRKWRLLLVWNLTKETIKENKEVKVEKNIKKISA